MLTHYRQCLICLDHGYAITHATTLSNEIIPRPGSATSYPAHDNSDRLLLNICEMLLASP